LATIRQNCTDLWTAVFPAAVLAGRPWGARPQVRAVLTNRRRRWAGNRFARRELADKTAGVSYPADVPVLSDDVVTLRALRPADIPGVVEQCNDPDSIRWTSVPVPYGEQQAAEWISSLVPAGWNDDRDLCFAVEHAGRFGGSVSLRPDSDGNAELAFGLTATARGKGVATRAVRLLLEWGFGQRGFPVVHWRANVGNWGSRRVAWAVGFHFGATIPKLLSQRGDRVDAWTGWLGADDRRRPRAPWFENPVLETPRLRLRSWRDDEIDRISSARTTEATAHFLPYIPQPFHADRARGLLARVREQASTGTRFNWCVADAETDLGLANITLFDLIDDPQDRRGELGYWTHPDAQGRGVTSEAVRRVAEWYFTPATAGGFGGLRLAIRTAGTNEAARRVAESAGFRWAGTERAAFALGDGTLDDQVLYDRLASDPVSPGSGPRTAGQVASGVVGGALTGGQPGPVVQVQGVGHRLVHRVGVVVVHPVEQMLADEAARVQVGDVEVGELRSEFLAQVVLRVGDHLPCLAHQPARRPGELGQPVGAEHQHGDDRDHDQFQCPDAEHAPPLSTVPRTVLEEPRTA
jgi:RimJ/RimL family protein N-acetyltransferase